MIKVREDLFSKSTSSNDSHEAKALLPIEDTEDGINIFLSDVHSLNRKKSIFQWDKC